MVFVEAVSPFRRRRCRLFRRCVRGSVSGVTAPVLVETMLVPGAADQPPALQQG